MKYVGGETYLEKVPSNLKYAELMHRLSEKVNGAVVVKYALPGEEVDNNNLITCIDDEQVQVRLVSSCHTVSKGPASVRYWRAKVAHLHLPDGSVLLLAKPVRLLAAQSAVYHTELASWVGTWGDSACSAGCSVSLQVIDRCGFAAGT